ncbi:MAG: hypothetical protein ACRDYE_08650 [Acidimicrobiales bacterium]
MTTGPAVFASMATLAAAGILPVVAAAGLRWVTVPLVPLGGAVVAALSATCFLAVGGTFMDWFVALAGAGALAVSWLWVARPDRRPWRTPGNDRPAHDGAFRLCGCIGALVVLACCAWCLRDLSTPSVGFDARAVWLMRSGWFLQSHHQLLVDMRVKDAVIVQSAYPPLVSASNAVAWGVTGDHSFRLGVVVIAVLNTCALAVAAFSLVELGRRFSVRLSGTDAEGGGFGARPQTPPPPPAPARLAPMVVGVVSAALLVFVAFGITEPFMTNGYADPIWSLAAVGAVAFGLQAPGLRSGPAITTVLLLVAGMSKVEGTATAAALIVLVAGRAVLTMSAPDRRRKGWRPLALGAVQLALVGAWPVLMRAIHARGDSSTLSPAGQWVGRAHATYDAMTPYLHVLVIAVPVAVVGGLVLGATRRLSGAANDGWGWAGLVCGLLVVGGAVVTGSGAVVPWLAVTVHRISEFPALAGWWILATWAVVASGAPALALRRRTPVGTPAPSTRSVPAGSPVVVAPAPARE